MSDRHDRLMDLVEEALALPPEARAVFLERTCDEPSLRVEALELIRYDAEADALLRGSQLAHINLDLVHDLADQVEELAPGERMQREPPAELGEYRIVRRLGDGASGTVFEAEQQHPQRRVALKLLRPELASTHALRRFQQEADLLAHLQHPGIAHIYDAGTLESEHGDIPYIAMELIDGQPLDVFARTRTLGTRDVLGLIAKVCDALSLAHERHIVHRDLKPANILVSPDCEPKIVDFGVAQAQGSELARTRVMTQHGQLIGTLSYMSPEQLTADQTSVDSRSDVYALGVILYELLSGRRPHNTDELSLVQLARVVSDHDPRPLSSLDTRLRGDVELIVMTALERDPERRYRSARELGDELQRFLQNEPITARRRTTAYKVRKFTARHKLVSGTLLGAFLSLILGLVVVARSAREARTARDQALEAKAESQWQVYRSRIQASQYGLELDDGVAATNQHQLAPEGERGWEWSYLARRLDAATQVIETGMSGVDHLLFSADGRVLLAAGRTATPGHGAFCSIELATQRVDASGLELESMIRRSDGQIVAAEVLSNGVRLIDVSAGGRELAHVSLPSRPTLLALTEQTDRIAAVLAQDPPVVGVWKVDSTEPLFLEQLSEQPDVLAIDTGSRHLAWGDPARGLEVRGLGDWESTLSRAQDTVRSLTFLDGDHLLVGADSRHVEIYDLRRRTLDGRRAHTASVTAVAGSAHGALMASGSKDRSVRIWRRSDWRQMRVLFGHDATVTALAFSPNSSRLASIDERGSVRIWNIDDDGSATAAGGFTATRKVLFSPDGTLLAAAAVDGTLRLFDTAGWTQLTSLIPPERVAGDGGWRPPVVVSLAWSPDSKLIASGHEDNRVRLWDVRTGQVRATLETSAPAALAVSPAGDILATGASDGRLQLRSLATAEPLDRLEHESRDPHPAAEITALRFGRTGPTLASAHADGSVWLWRIPEAEARRVVAPTADGSFARQLVFSSDAKRLLTVSSHGIAHLVDTEVESRRTLDTGDYPVQGVAFTPDDHRIVTVGRDQALSFWSATSLERVLTFTSAYGQLHDIAVSPSGNVVVAAATDRSLSLWHAEPVRTTHERRAAALARQDRLLNDLVDSSSHPRQLSADTATEDAELNTTGKFAPVSVLETPSPAVEIEVTTTADVMAADGHCGLREALLAANSRRAVDVCPAGGTHTRIMLPAGVIELDIPGRDEDLGLTGDLDISANVQLIGRGAMLTVIDGNGLDRTLHLPPSHAISVALVGLTVTGGDAYKGGGISNGSGDIGTAKLRLIEVELRDNVGVDTGGLFNGRRAEVEVLRSSIIDNRSSLHGGGVLNAGTMVLSNTTISGNRAGKKGGGIAHFLSPLILNNCTVTDNVAASGAGTYSDVDDLSVSNSIVAGNRQWDGEPSNCERLISAGNNLLGPACESSILTSSDTSSDDPGLGRLGLNGGGTRSHRPLITSAALHGVVPTGAADARLCEERDQAGRERGSGRCVIGAIDLPVDRDARIDAAQ